MSFTLNSFRKLRRLISLLCLLAVLVPILSMCMPTQAYAASKYKVKQWSDGHDTQYYYVYTGCLPKHIDPTFIRQEWNNYYSDDGNIRIAFYCPYGTTSSAKSNAFYQYLLSKTKARYAYAGWYSFNYSTYTSYHAFKIEGWNNNLSINKLLNAGPFYNIDGEKLEVIYIGRGDIVQQKWSYIRNTLNCFTAIHFKMQNPKVGVTVGLRLTDVYGGVNTYAYT